MMRLAAKEKQCQVLQAEVAAKQEVSPKAADEAAGARDPRDALALKLFRKLLLERFSQVKPEDVRRALKMEQRPSVVPRTEVDKVLRKFEEHQANVSWEKVFRRMARSDAGSLPATDFADSIQQTLLCDEKTASHLFALLKSQSCAGGGDAAGGEAAMGLSVHEFVQLLNDPRIR